MLRLPKFQYHAPRSVVEAANLLAELQQRGQSAKLLAGGTDLLPNMKHEITVVDHVISTAGLGLAGIEVQGGEIHIGASTPLQDVADSPLIRDPLPALADACAQIAGPQLRRMGTLGGNICLDTRCVYINQTHFWRQALGFCLKKDGSVCHVVTGGRNCVAAASNDSVLPLMLYGAKLQITSARNEREIPLDQLYVADGLRNIALENDEILTSIRIPLPGPRIRCAFEKLRIRKSIDFPLQNVAVLFETDENGALVQLAAVVSALGAKPKRLNLSAGSVGHPLNDDTIARVRRKAFAACRPLSNIATDPTWRRAMIPVLLERALRRLRTN